MSALPLARAGAGARRLTREDRLRLVWQAAQLAALVALALFWIMHGLQHPVIDKDGAAYWGVRDGHFYEFPWLNEATGGPVPFVYSPAFAQALWPFAQLPLLPFLALWLAFQLAVLVWLVGPVPAALLAFLYPPLGLTNLANGHLYVLMAAALALSLRYPQFWAFQVLTKVTPGVGILWHVVRREWRSAGLALGTTTAIALASVLLFGIAPWEQWTGILSGAAAGHAVPYGTLPIPIELKVPLTAALTALIAWRGLVYLLPLVIYLSLPQVGLSGSVLLLACFYWWRIRMPAVQRPRRSSAPMPPPARR